MLGPRRLCIFALITREKPEKNGATVRITRACNNPVKNMVADIMACSYLKMAIRRIINVRTMYRQYIRMSPIWID